MLSCGVFLLYFTMSPSGGLEAKSATFNTFHHWPFGTSILSLCYCMYRLDRQATRVRVDEGRHRTADGEFFWS